MTDAHAQRPEIATLVSRMFGQNTYVAHFPDRTDCVVVDPGFDSDQILDYLVRHRLTPAALLITHAHIDHIAGNEALRRQWPNCPIIIGRVDAPKLTDPMGNLSGLYDFSLTSPPADQLLDDDQEISCAGFDLWVRTVPGHSTGHVVFIWRGSSPWLVFGGDVLFQGSVGRTDFPGGSFETLSAGIHSKLFTLPEETIVLPGHGPRTTIGSERRENPFVGEAATRRRAQILTGRP